MLVLENFSRVVEKVFSFRSRDILDRIVKERFGVTALGGRSFRCFI